MRIALLVCAVSLLSACESVGIPKERQPTDWAPIVGAGSRCQGIDGTYSNKGTMVDSSRSGEARDVWFTDLFNTPPGWTRWGVVRSHPSRFEEIAEDLHACDRMTISIEPPGPVGEQERGFRIEAPREQKNVFRMKIVLTRAEGSGSASDRRLCMSAAVPWSSGYASPATVAEAILLCQPNDNLFIAGQVGSINQVNLRLSRAADGSLVAFVSGPFYPSGFWARFAQVSE